MPLEQTLERIGHELESGDLGKARDRLHGLLSSFPDNLELRRRLGEVYWRLQMPEMAGRYWYLEEMKTPEMLAACGRFESQFKNNPALMLIALRYKGGLKALEGTFAGNTLAKLDKQARKLHKWYAIYREPLTGNPAAGKKRSKDAGPACSILAIVLLVLFAIGVVNGILSLIGWVR